jgi:flagellar biosynthesis/type III secretory pathway protein FliH
MNFCIETISHDDGLRAEQGVLRQNGLAITSDAALCAQRRLADAQAEAAQLLQQAQQQADQLIEQAQQDTLQRLRDQLAAFDTQYASFIDRAQPLVIQLALGLFDRLVSSMSDRERVEALVKRIAMEAPSKLTEVMLHLHPDDACHLTECEWPVKSDPEMRVGTALLVADSGEWRMDFEVAVGLLKNTLSRQLDIPAAT